MRVFIVYNNVVVYRLYLVANTHSPLLPHAPTTWRCSSYVSCDTVFCHAPELSFIHSYAGTTVICLPNEGTCTLSLQLLNNVNELHTALWSGLKGKSNTSLKYSNDFFSIVGWQNVTKTDFSKLSVIFTQPCSCDWRVNLIQTWIIHYMSFFFLVKWDETWILAYVQPLSIT